MKLLYIPFLFITFSSFAQNFTPENSPIEFNGTLEHFRTVWFSADNKSVYGDGKSIIGFDMNTGRQIINVPIEGYCVHPSSQSRGRRYWIQGNSNYNDPANPQITNMHNNLGFYDVSTEVMKAQKTDGISLSIVKHSTKRNTAYGIVRKSNVESIIEFQIDPFKIIRTIAKENNGNYILGLDVNENSGLLAYSYAGNSRGIKFVELESGALKKNISINEEFSSLEFTADGKVLFAAAFNKLYKIDALTYQSKSFNLDPDNDKSHAFSISVHPNNRSIAYSSKYGTSILDAENGTVKKIDKGQSMACRFSKDGRHLATSVKPFLVPESVCLRVFSDLTFPLTNTSEEVVPVPPPFNPALDWYQHRGPAFAIDFPIKPKLSTKTSKKGYVTSEYTSIHNKSAYLAIVTEISPKVKPSKYEKIAGKIGKKFLENIGAGKSVQQPYSYGELDGVCHSFKMGAFDYEYLCICINGYAFQIICLNAEQNTNDLDRFFASFHPLK
jgi:hypothetical protein